MLKENNKILNVKDGYSYGASNSNFVNNATDMEIDDEKRARTRSIWVVNIEIFIFAIGFSIVTTGVLPYLQQVTLQVILST